MNSVRPPSSLPVPVFIDSLSRMSRRKVHGFDSLDWDEAGYKPEVQSRILHALKFFGIVDGAGVLTRLGDSVLYDLRDRDGEHAFRSTILALVKLGYRDLFRALPEGFNLSQSTLGQIEEIFRHQFALSESTTGKALTFFVGLWQVTGEPLSEGIATAFRTPRVSQRLQRDADAGTSHLARPLESTIDNSETGVLCEIEIRFLNENRESKAIKYRGRPPAGLSVLMRSILDELK